VSTCFRELRLSAQLTQGSRTAGSIILNMTYGYQTQEHNDPFVKRVENAMDQISKFLQPGLFYVDTLHWRAYLLG
jgi:hypothetical protein